MTAVLNVPLSSDSREAVEVSLGYGGHGVELVYLSPRGARKLHLMLTASRARALSKALRLAADASETLASRKTGAAGEPQP